MKKKIEKIYFVHRGAHFCEISIFAQSEITRPFHKIKAWNKKEKIFFYHFKHKNLKKNMNFFSGRFFFLSQNLKNVYGRLFFLGWLRCPIPVAIEFYSQKEKVSSCKRPIFWLEHIFSKKCKKKFFFWRGEGGSRKLFFTILQMVPLIFCPKLSYKAKIPLININRKKSQGG